MEAKTVRAVLARKSDSVYVHCKSGKDRSPFVVYAFLQLTYGIDEPDARAALNVRIGKNGQILSNLDVQQEEPRDWLARALAA